MTLLTTCDSASPMRWVKQRSHGLAAAFSSSQGRLHSNAVARRFARWRLEREPLPTWDVPAPEPVSTHPVGGVAFVFQGGGSLTAPQVGMLRALLEAGISPDFVIGASAGALNAVTFATDPTLAGLDRLEQLWMLLRRRHVAAFSAGSIVRAITGRSDGFFSNNRLVSLLGIGLVPKSLEHTAIPAYVVATDVVTGEPVVLSEGDTTQALLASCAIPGFYAPVEIDGRRLVDGGVAADVPVLQAEELGAQVSYVFGSAEASESDGVLRGPFSIVLHALDHVLISANRRDIAAAQGAVYVLPTVTSPITNPVDFSDTARLMAEGYRVTVEWLADHERTQNRTANGSAHNADLETSRRSEYSNAG